MFGKKKSNLNPQGVALGQLLIALQATTIKASMDGDILVAQHEHYKVRVEVIPPATRESKNGPIKAVVRVISELPKPFLQLFAGKEAGVTATFNSFAAMGSINVDHGKVSIGSRLTIYEAEDAWSSLHLPLLMFTVIGGTQGILGGIRRVISNEDTAEGESEWIANDFEGVQKFLSRVSVCTVSESGLTAEFGLSKGAASAVAGHHDTALFQMMADQPHPELGGGLFCLLQMPHQISNQEKLQEICLQLNNMEMAECDSPPHFGAWCEGRLGGNPAYVSFLPNALYSVNGIALNASIWALHRAQWANRVLASMGVDS